MIKLINKPRTISGVLIARWYIDGERHRFWPTEEGAKEYILKNSCRECGAFECNGECHGDDMMGDS